MGMACVASVVASYRGLILLVRSEHQRWCDFLFGWGIFLAWHRCSQTYGTVGTVPAADLSTSSLKSVFWPPEVAYTDGHHSIGNLGLQPPWCSSSHSRVVPAISGLYILYIDIIKYSYNIYYIYEHNIGFYIYYIILLQHRYIYIYIHVIMYIVHIAVRRIFMQCDIIYIYIYFIHHYPL